MPASSEPRATTPPVPAGRLHYLDGLRGWAALWVVIYHSSWELFGFRDPWIRVRWLSLANDGLLAVFVFFVLSGVVLSQPFLRTGDPRRVVRMALARYPRLAIPVAAASLIALAMMQGGMIFNRQAAIVVMGQEWLGTFLLHRPSLASWFDFSAYHAFFAYDGAETYGPFLWTMPIEFLGSFLLFAIFGLLGRNPVIRTVGYVAGLWFAAMLQPMAAAFILGALIAELMTSRRYGVLLRSRSAAAAGALLLVAAGVGSSLLRLHYNVPICLLLAAALVLAAVLSQQLQRLLAMPVSQWLGQVSFPLYLMHGLVICGPASWLILRLDAAGASQPAMAAIVVPASIGLSLAAARLLTPVERLAIAASHRFAAMVMSGAEPWLTGQRPAMASSRIASTAPRER